MKPSPIVAGSSLVLRVPARFLKQGMTFSIDGGPTFIAEKLEKADNRIIIKKNDGTGAAAFKPEIPVNIVLKKDINEREIAELSASVT